MMSFKKRLRPWVDRAAAACGLLAQCERSMRRGLTILTYHRILPDEACLDYPLPSIVMPQSAFRQQMAALARRFRIVPVREALGDLESRGAASGTAVVSITFDDGYLDNYEIAAPILEEFRLRGTFFLAPQTIETDGSYWFDRAASAWTDGCVSSKADSIRGLLESVSAANLEWRSCRAWISFLKGVKVAERDAILDALADGASGRLDSYRVMSIDQARDLDRRGHEIGSHSLTHPILPWLEDDELRRELRDSRSRLEEWVGHTVEGFCYPNGDADKRVLEETRAAGYKYACSVAPGLNTAPYDRYRLMRRDMTTSRVTDELKPCELSFRAEISGMRELFRER